MYSPFLDLANDFKLQALQELWHWIPGWIDQAHGEAGRMVVFRRQITLPSVPKQTVIRISADTRYKLLVNGHRVCVGPARGSDRLWFYDTVDLGPFLQVGLHTFTRAHSFRIHCFTRHFDGKRVDSRAGGSAAISVPHPTGRLPERDLPESVHG
jgi:hypothetical protein